jgi:hypothetical protein
MINWFKTLGWAFLFGTVMGLLTMAVISSMAQNPPTTPTTTPTGATAEVVKKDQVKEVENKYEATIVTLKLFADTFLRPFCGDIGNLPKLGIFTNADATCYNSANSCSIAKMRSAIDDKNTGLEKKSGLGSVKQSCYENRCDIDYNTFYKDNGIFNIFGISRISTENQANQGSTAPNSQQSSPNKEAFDYLSLQSSCKGQTTLFRNQSNFFGSLLIYVIPITLICLMVKVVRDKVSIVNVFGITLATFFSAVFISAFCYISIFIGQIIIDIVYSLGFFTKTGENSIVNKILFESIFSNKGRFDSPMLEGVVEYVTKAYGGVYTVDTFANIQTGILVIFAWTALSLFLTLIINNFTLQMLAFLAPLIVVYGVMAEVSVMTKFWGIWHECILRQIFFVIVLSGISNVFIYGGLFDNSLGSAAEFMRWIIVLSATPQIVNMFISMVSPGQSVTAQGIQGVISSVQSTTQMMSQAKSALGGGGHGANGNSGLGGSNGSNGNNGSSGQDGLAGMDPQERQHLREMEIRRERQQNGVDNYNPYLGTSGSTSSNGSSSSSGSSGTFGTSGTNGTNYGSSSSYPSGSSSQLGGGSVVTSSTAGYSSDYSSQYPSGSFGSYDYDPSKRGGSYSSYGSNSGNSGSQSHGGSGGNVGQAGQIDRPKRRSYYGHD